MGNLNIKSLLICCCFIFFTSISAFACSGEFTEELIRSNESYAFMIGTIGVGFFLAILILFLLRGKKGLPTLAVCAVILALHPGWTDGAWIGDCGTSVVSGAKYFTSALFVGFVVQLLFYFYNRFYLKSGLK